MIQIIFIYLLLYIISYKLIILYFISALQIDIWRKKTNLIYECAYDVIDFDEKTSLNQGSDEILKLPPKKFVS